jgi:hypothetical protein
MKAYYDYEDGTFWAIRTEGENCFIAEGSKYDDFWPDLMLKAGTEEKQLWGAMSPNGRKIPCESPDAAEQKAAKMMAEKSVAAIRQDVEFWRIAIDINAMLLFFVPDVYKAQELCALAVVKNGGALQYVPPEMRSPELCKRAVYNNSYALEYVGENEKTE